MNFDGAFFPLEGFRWRREVCAVRCGRHRGKRVCRALVAGVFDTDKGRRLVTHWPATMTLQGIKEVRRVMAEETGKVGRIQIFNSDLHAEPWPSAAETWCERCHKPVTFDPNEALASGTREFLV